MDYYMFGIEYHDGYDSYYFVSDGEWVEDAPCSIEDENCPFCFERPETAYTKLIQMPV